MGRGSGSPARRGEPVLERETDTLDKMQARIEYDLDHLRFWSLPLDLWIIARTLKVFTGRDNAY
jgi:putative colanic acid biosynthesis UDP-glucose lipid carrier transferase